MRLLIAALALMASACSPMASQTPDGAATSELSPAACAERNGTMQRVGRLQTLQCVVRYADAGKRCTDGDQCEGDCRAIEIMGSSEFPVTAAEREAVPGLCQANSNNFGCNTPIEDGRPGATLCID